MRYIVLYTTSASSAGSDRRDYAIKEADDALAAGNDYLNEHNPVPDTSFLHVIEWPTNKECGRVRTFRVRAKLEERAM